jgi:hypothetical protein
MRFPSFLWQIIGRESSRPNDICYPRSGAKVKRPLHPTVQFGKIPLFVRDDSDPQSVISSEARNPFRSVQPGQIQTEPLSFTPRFSYLEQGLLLPAGVGSSEHFMRFFGDSLLCFQSTFEADHADFGV